MKVYTLQSKVWVPHPREGVFEFFSRAENLQTLTPHWLHFSILSPGPIAMKAGTRIRYRLRLHGIPIRWESEPRIGNRHIDSWTSKRLDLIVDGSTSTSSWRTREAPRYAIPCNTRSSEVSW
jgi:ligand-binding SRPBCC domain-containing protein